MQLRREDRTLGWLHVELQATATTTESDPATSRSSWGGRTMGSDYLAWGANHQKLTLEFEDGTTGDVVVRATGQLRGLGDVPAVLLETISDSTPKGTR